MGLAIWLGMYVDTGDVEPFYVDIYSNSCTHNLQPMWNKAGTYDALYNSSGKLAGDIVDILEKGLKDMQDKIEEYKKLNPPNGWGDYDGALWFLTSFLEACKKHPKATIGLSK